MTNSKETEVYRDGKYIIKKELNGYHYHHNLYTMTGEYIISSTYAKLPNVLSTLTEMGYMS